ncbi:MAG: hypothetical protein CL920_07195 [Deltaproteobacteria bacterium]|nr:hypothetical protein [Deltaproteobacteria bacterium]|tara:strand:- start:8113 stop:8370 length:258 start_codon:yes stop_codon:yes gene_type:complete
MRVSPKKEVVGLSKKAFALLYALLLAFACALYTNPPNNSKHFLTTFTQRTKKMKEYTSAVTLQHCKNTIKNCKIDTKQAINTWKA